MFKIARTYILIAFALLAYSSSASATIFEMNHGFSAAVTASANPYRLDGHKKGLYQATSVDRESVLSFASGKLGLVNPEDLLWVAIGDTGFSSFQTTQSIADSSLYLAEADHFLTEKTGRNGADHAPAESSTPEIWATILIGAGLIWSQLRRKTRHGAIRFMAP